MPPLPTLGGQEVIRTFQSFGWQIVRRRGSHVMMSKPGETSTPSIPDHKEVAKGTLRRLIRSANLTIDEFLAVA